MATVTIGSTTYDVYQDVASADEYFNASSRFDDWDSLTDDEKARALVSSTRLIDRQSWKGEKVSDAQALQFPRTGVTNCAGEDVEPADTLAKAEEASLLLALDISDGLPVETSGSTENQVQTLKAGSVMITNFRAPIGSGERFPQPTMELIGCFFTGASAGNIGLSLSYGTDGEAFDSDFGFNGGIT